MKLLDCRENDVYTVFVYPLEIFDFIYTYFFIGEFDRPIKKIF